MDETSSVEQSKPKQYVLYGVTVLLFVLSLGGLGWVGYVWFTAGEEGHFALPGDTTTPTVGTDGSTTTTTSSVGKGATNTGTLPLGFANSPFVKIFGLVATSNTEVFPVPEAATTVVVETARPKVRWGGTQLSLAIPKHNLTVQLPENFSFSEQGIDTVNSGVVRGKLLASYGLFYMRDMRVPVHATLVIYGTKNLYAWNDGWYYYDARTRAWVFTGITERTETPKPILDSTVVATTTVQTAGHTRSGETITGPFVYASGDATESVYAVQSSMQDEMVMISETLQPEIEATRLGNSYGETTANDLFAIAARFDPLVALEQMSFVKQ